MSWPWVMDEGEGTVVSGDCNQILAEEIYHINHCSK